jgi:hypothetical protein
MFAMYAPVTPVHDMADEAVKPRLIRPGVKLQARPDGETKLPRRTSPPRPLMLLAVIVRRPVSPVRKLIAGGAERVKSTTLKGTLREVDWVPSDPRMATT